ncbi:helix-turn-helix domain-containing protein [Streptomyces sp. AC558_RSS880]|uniref:helix-turn-helix domain-containing protein n=1 Tax=Streptomyces sp. AC558_RSS880 TaxID=2823687 RepID=UPI0035B2D6E4
MMRAMPGFPSEAKWLRHAHTHPRHLFASLPQRPDCNKRPRKAAGLLRQVTRFLAPTTSAWSDDMWVGDCETFGSVSHSVDCETEPNTGQTRLWHAARLLWSTVLPVARVAEASGCAGPFHFSSAFRRRYGVPPRDYRAAGRVTS